MRSLAQRIQLLEPIAAHDRALRELLDRAAPQLLTERGIGHITAASSTSPGPTPGRCHSEAAFARLGGTSPVPATSGQNQTRHRLNRGGDRQLNRALYLVAVTKRPATQRPRRTSPAVSPKARPNAKPSAASSVSSPGACGGSRQNVSFSESPTSTPRDFTVAVGM